VNADEAASDAKVRRRFAEEAGFAARNAIKLGLSLVATWGVAILVRLYLPRYLGPDRFGLYSFLDSLASSAVAFTTLGIDGYTQREIPVRPQHASDYFGGVLALRFLLGALVLAGLFGGLIASGRSLEAASVAVVFGTAYVVRVATQSQSALLVAHGTVNRLALTNVATKVAWGALVAVALWLGGSLTLLAAAFLAGELLRGPLLHHEARRRLGLRLRLDVPASWRAVAASTPFYANQVTMNLSRVDVPVLSFMTRDDRVVGWYGAAMSFSLLVYLLSPVLDSVLLPLMSRLRSRSEADMWRLVHRSAEALVALSTPLALMVILGADLCVRVAFGDAFAPAAGSLRVFAVQAVLAYLTLLMSNALIALGRGWTVTISSAVGLVLRPVLIVALIPPCARYFGVGGAGVGAALGLAASEVVVLAVMLRDVGWTALGGHTHRLALRCALLCAGTALLHAALAGLGNWRLLVDGVAYLVGALALRALPIRQIGTLVREIVANRRAPRPA
jgi:O-antigen/teichoic acid export membrane protein